MNEIAPGVFEHGPAGSPPAVARSVSMRQAQLALLDAGLLDEVEAAIAALPEPQRTRTQIEWNRGGVVERNAPTVALLAAATGLSEAQLDTLFEQAATL